MAPAGYLAEHDAHACRRIPKSVYNFSTDVAEEALWVT